MPTNKPTVGDRFILDGHEYVINRVNVHTGNSAAKPVRVQIDAMAVDEVIRRRDNMNLLLEGEPAGGSGTAVSDV